MPSIIFDLDQTLVDSSSVESFRKSGNWQETYRGISSFIVYDGLAAMFQFIRDEHIKVCIVTTSPATYCSKVLTHWSIPYDYKVCYHDVQHRKPHPQSFLKAIELLNDNPANILSLGDRAVDIQASEATNIKSVGCLWGTAERQLLIAANPNYLAETPADALAILKREMSIS